MKRQAKIFACLVGIDLIGIIMALTFGLTLRQVVLPHLSHVFQSDIQLRLEYLWLVVILVSVFAYDGLYVKRHTAWEEFRHILRSVSITMIFFLAIMTIMKSGADISRPALIIAWLLAPAFLVGLRVWVKKHLLVKSSFWPRRFLIVGKNVEAVQVSRHLGLFSELGYELVGFVGNTDQVFDLPEKYLGPLNRLEVIVKEQGVDELVIALPGESRIKQFDLLKRAEALVPRVSVLPELFDADKLNVDIEKVERYFFLSFQNNLMRPSNRCLKNSFEVLMILLFLPLWGVALLLLSIAVKLSSSGPVFFAQERIGVGGNIFRCYKFRTMSVDAADLLENLFREHPQLRHEWETERKLKDDPRITHIGRFLRRTSLDELPQIINVLRGEMSLVGPRPIVSEEIPKYGDYFRYYKAVCPGLSGLWQVSGRNDVGYEQRVMLDTFYVRNWSLWMDFVILLRTLPAVWKKEGAY